MNTVRDNPYIGPRTFEEDERDRFFGRDREANELLALVLSEQLTLFYAESGAGKSSLVNTCLIPDLKQKGFEIFLGRVGGDAPTGLTVDNIFAFNLMRTLLTSEVDLTRLTGMSLSKFLAEIPISALAESGQASKRRALIIDQFEELFSTHPEAWQKRDDFFEQLAQAMEDDPHLRVILVMREDYTASLDPYAHLMPNRFRMRYYMQQLGYEAALKAVRKPVERKEFDRPYAAGVAEKLVDDLRSIRVMGPDGKLDKQLGQYVEPVQLQVICFNLWKKLPPGGRQITEKDLEEVGDITTSLGNYFAERVNSVAEAAGVPERKIRDWFVKKLISPGGQRNMVLLEPDGRSGGLEDRVIQELPDLIRTEHRGGTVFYELTHDRMVEPILANNKVWESQHLNLLQRGAALWSERDRSDGLLLRGNELISAEAEARDLDLTDLEKTYLEASRKLRAQENKERSRNRLLVFLTFSALIAMCAAIIFGGISFVARSEASSNAATAQASDQEAQRQLRRSESLRYALQSKMLLVNDVNSNPELAALLSIRSLKGEYVPEADAALVESMDRLYAVYTFMGHTGEIKSVAVSMDGSYLATGGQDQTAKVWDIQTGNLVQTLEGHEGVVSDVAFSPDGRYLLTGSFDNTAKIWDLSSGEAIWTLRGHTNTILGVAYSPKGDFVLTGSNDHSAKLWDANTGEEIRSFTSHKGAVWDVVFSSGGDYILTGSDDMTAKLWDFDTGTEIYTFEGYGGEIYSVSFSPDNKQIVIGGRGSSDAEIWDIDSRQRVLSLSAHHNTTDAVAFSNNGLYVLTGSFDGTAILWSSKTGEILRIFSGHTNWINSITFSPDDQYIYTGSSDATAKMWLTLEVRVPRKVTGEDQIEKVIFSPDGQSFLTSGREGYSIMWSTVTGKGIHVYKGLNSFYDTSVISPDGKYILAINNDGIVALWEVETGKEIQTYDHSVWSVAIAPNSEYILTGGSDGTAKLWETNSGREVRAFEGHQGGIPAVAFSPDGKQIFTTGNDNSSKVWDVETGQEVFTLDYFQRLWTAAFSPDGKYILTGSLDHTARLWNADTGEEIRVFRGHADRVFGVAFSSDGKYILTGSADHTAKLWNSETGEEIRTLSGHTGSIYSVAFSPDDRYLITAGEDGTARIWDFDYQTTIDLACSMLTRDFTSEERNQFGISDDDPTCVFQQSIVVPVTSSTGPAPAEIESLLYTGHILETLALLNKIETSDPGFAENLDAGFWNLLCWRGSLNGFFMEVQDFCERAVQLDPENANIRDSRGLNRALLGDYQAAIEDFEYAVQQWRESGLNDEVVNKREDWINSLRAGDNPFTENVLDILKSE